MSPNWGQELSTQLIHQVHKYECIWKRESAGSKDINAKRNEAWDAITKEMQQYNPDLTLFDVKDRYRVLRSLYMRLDKKYRTSKERPKSWIYDQMHFLPSPKEKDRTVNFSNKETEKLIQLLEANECLWVNSYATENVQNKERRSLALKEIHREIQKINPQITFRILQRKIVQIKYDFYSYARQKGRAKLKQSPPLWYARLSFLKRNLIGEIDEEGTDNQNIQYLEEESLEAFSEEEDYYGDSTAIEREENLEIEVNDTLETEKELKEFTINSCRICLENNGQLNMSEGTPSYINFYERFFQLSFDDANYKFPKKICADCAIKLTNTYELAEKAIKSNKILRNYMSSQIWSDCPDLEEKLVESLEVNEPTNLEIFEEEPFKNQEKDQSNSDTKYLVKSLNELLETEDLTAYEKTEEKLDVSVVLAENEDISEECIQFSENEEHMEEDQDEEECNEISENEEVIDKNLKNTQGSGKPKRRPENPVMCHICSKTLKSKKALERHVERHDKNRQRKYECEICGVKMFSVSEFNGHKKIHDPERTRRYQCEFCDKAYFTSGSLTVHRRIHTGETFPCTLCPKTFCTKLLLTEHLNVHVGNKTYECEVCGEKFFRNSSYNTHKNQFHIGLKYKCKYCSREFNRRDKLKAHIYGHKGYPYECGFCGSGRATRYKCRVHIMQVHKIENVVEANGHVKIIDSNKFRLESIKKQKMSLINSKDPSYVSVVET